MRSVRILPAVALALNTAALGGQEARALAADEIDVVVAALERYVSDLPGARSREGQVTLVLAPETTGVLDAPPDKWAARAREPRAIALSARQTDQLQGRSGAALKTCSFLDRDRGWELCGIPQPWRWLQLLNPWVEGDEASVLIHDAWIEFGPRALQPEGTFVRVSTRVYLRRGSEGWNVVRSVVVGET